MLHNKRICLINKKGDIEIFQYNKNIKKELKFQLIEHNIQIEDDVQIEDFVYVYYNVHINKGVKIGKFVTVCNDVNIGANTIIESGASISNNVQIKENSYIKKNISVLLIKGNTYFIDYDKYYGEYLAEEKFLKEKFLKNGNNT